MNIIFKRTILIGALFLASCLQGPWEYYPEESVAFRGIYTIGQVIAGTAPEACFTPLLSLDESLASDFAFYDSAFVQVSGVFKDLGEVDVVLTPLAGKPNCFISPSEPQLKALRGESYQMKAVFKWDSLGTRVVSTYMAEATIPTQFSIKEIFAPLDKKAYVDLTESFKEKIPTVDFLEYPNDVVNYKFVTDYDESVRGVLLTVRYDNENGGESPRTSMTKYVSDIFGSDSGTLPINLFSPFDTIARNSFTENIKIGKIKSLDTLSILNASLPIGLVTLYFYATDQAFTDYATTIMGGNDDPRIKPISNVKNGMGVFSGMIKEELTWEIQGFFYTYSSIAFNLCRRNNWDDRSCRLALAQICADTLYAVPECHAPAVQIALEKEEDLWSVYLPDTISAADKNNAYADGLKLYCLTSNFKNTSLANCDEYKKLCQIDKENNKVKELLWQWCADRRWDYKTYPQCGTAIVSRYRLQNQKSNILKRVVDSWCSEYPKDVQCGY